MFEALLVAGWLATVLGFLVYLHKLNAATRAERQEMFQRLQAPEKAVIDYAPPKQVEEPDDSLVPFDPGMWGPPIPDEVA